jgi:hypothetical protein
MTVNVTLSLSKGDWLTMTTKITLTPPLGSCLRGNDTIFTNHEISTI